jgi:hypothetical protein
MRRARLLVAVLLGLALGASGLVTATTPAATAASAVAKYKPTETQTYKVEVLGQLYATQAEGVAHFYCAVGIFVAFNDAQGYDAVRGDLVINSAPVSVPLGDPPYDDGATTGGLDFPPGIAQHHVRVLPWAEFHASGPVDANQQCSDLRDQTDAAVSDTATITYQAVGSCGKAISKQKKAAEAVKKAKKKVRHASGPGLAAAQAALGRAKSKLSKAQAKVVRVCAVVRVAGRSAPAARRAAPGWP